MLRGQHNSRTFGAGPVMGFSGKKAKSKNRPRCRAKGWASHQTRLGEAVLRGRWASPYSFGRTRTHWASHQNEVGRASTKGPLGEPVLIGRARTHWASQCCACSASKVPAWVPARHVYLSACSALCLLGTVPARHCACSARLLKCLLGTVPARHCACSALRLLGTFTLVPARHCACSACPPRSSPGCPTYGSLTRKKQGGTLGVNHM